MEKKEYIKKYMSSTRKMSGHKKKKKEHSSKQERVQLIDDDIDVRKTRDDEDDLDYILSGEDAPQVVGVIDDRPSELKTVEDYRNSNRWKSVSSGSRGNDRERSDERHFKRHIDHGEEHKRNYLEEVSPRKCSRYSDGEVSSPKRSQRIKDFSPPRKSNKTSEDKNVYYSKRERGPPQSQSSPKRYKDNNYTAYKEISVKYEVDYRRSTIEDRRSYSQPRESNMKIQRKRKYSTEDKYDYQTRDYRDDYRVESGREEFKEKFPKNYYRKTTYTENNSGNFENRGRNDYNKNDNYFSKDRNREKRSNIDNDYNYSSKSSRDNYYPPEKNFRERRPYTNKNDHHIEHFEMKNNYSTGSFKDKKSRRNSYDETEPRYENNRVNNFRHDSKKNIRRESSLTNHHHKDDGYKQNDFRYDDREQHNNRFQENRPRSFAAHKKPFQNRNMHFKHKNDTRIISDYKRPNFIRKFNTNNSGYDRGNQRQFRFKHQNNSNFDNRFKDKIGMRGDKFQQRQGFRRREPNSMDRFVKRRPFDKQNNHFVKKNFNKNQWDDSRDLRK